MFSYICIKFYHILYHLPSILLFGWGRRKLVSCDWRLLIYIIYLSLKCWDRFWYQPKQLRHKKKEKKEEKKEFCKGGRYHGRGGALAGKGGRTVGSRDQFMFKMSQKLVRYITERIPI